MFLGIMLLLCLVTACSGNTVLPSSGSVTHVASTSTPTYQPVHSELVGTYTMTITQKDIATITDADLRTDVGTWVLTLMNDGYYSALNGSPLTRYIGSGQYMATQNLLTVVRSSKCLEYYGPLATDATYTWKLQGRTLTLKAVQDLCPTRRQVFTTHPWLKQA